MWQWAKLGKRVKWRTTSGVICCWLLHCNFQKSKCFEYIRFFYLHASENKVQFKICDVYLNWCLTQRQHLLTSSEKRIRAKASLRRIKLSICRGVAVITCQLISHRTLRLKISNYDQNNKRLIARAIITSKLQLKAWYKTRFICEKWNIISRKKPQRMSVSTVSGLVLHKKYFHWRHSIIIALVFFKNYFNIYEPSYLFATAWEISSPPQFNIPSSQLFRSFIR